MRCYFIAGHDVWFVESGVYGTCFTVKQSEERASRSGWTLLRDGIRT